jgi:NADPH:quinone reductase-like Zn-dependent oxidoreductase
VESRSTALVELVERARPAAPANHIVVRVRAASLNYRDLMIAKGLYGGPSKDDLVPLSDGAGEVVELGAGVTRWEVGDRVAGAYYPAWRTGPMRAEYMHRQLGIGTSDGMLAEYAVLSETGAVRVPDYLSYEEGATLPCAAVTAWTTLHDGQAMTPGETLLVQGTGGVSIFAAQIAQAYGIRVIATTSSDAKAARLRELGITEIIDYRKTPEWQKEVLAMTDGVGVDRIIEVGGSGTLPRSFEALKFGGTIGLVGLLTGIGGQIDPLPVLFKAVDLRGILVGSVDGFEALNRALARWKLRPVIDEVFPLDRAAAALAKLEAGKHLGKIVVRID